MRGSADVRAEVAALVSVGVQRRFGKAVLVHKEPAKVLHIGAVRWNFGKVGGLEEHGPVGVPALGVDEVMLKLVQSCCEGVDVDIGILELGSELLRVDVVVRGRLASATSSTSASS